MGSRAPRVSPCPSGGSQGLALQPTEANAPGLLTALSQHDSQGSGGSHISDNLTLLRLLRRARETVLPSRPYIMMRFSGQTAGGGADGQPTLSRALILGIGSIAALLLFDAGLSYRNTRQ